MKVWRAMSEKEFQLFNSGAPIIGRCSFSDKNNGYKIKKGVCFFTNANNCAHWGGKVICCFFIPKRFLEKSWGIYPDLCSDDWGAVVECEEYAIPQYSKENAVLLAYGFENINTGMVEIFSHYGIQNQRILGVYTSSRKFRFNSRAYRKMRKFRNKNG